MSPNASLMAIASIRKVSELYITHTKNGFNTLEKAQQSTGNHIPLSVAIGMRIRMKKDADCAGGSVPLGYHLQQE